jgi:hypothetical protein
MDPVGRGLLTRSDLPAVYEECYRRNVPLYESKALVLGLGSTPKNTEAFFYQFFAELLRDRPPRHRRARLRRFSAF